MVVGQVETDAHTRARLGSQGMAVVTDCLWAKHCQSCGRPLADVRAAALAVDDLGSVTRASLHHPRCRRPGWNESGSISSAPLAMLSSASKSMVVTFERRAGQWAMLVTNPGLEAIPIHRAEGRWRLDLTPYLAVGLAPKQLMIGKPIPGAAASLGSDSITVVMNDMPLAIYNTPADRPALALARRQAGMVWAVSYALHPGYLKGNDLATAMRSDRLVAGWVALTG